MSKGRHVIVVCGVKDKLYSSKVKPLIADYGWIDCTEYLPHDPSHDAKQTTVHNVVGQKGFEACLTEAVAQCMANPKTAIACHWGAHRSPVVAACAAETLRTAGMTVAVCEVKMLRPELIPYMIAACEDLSIECCEMLVGQV